MRRVWAWMALNFGKHAGIVGAIGQAMLTLFTMEGGRDVVDLFTPENIQHMQQVDEQLHAVDGVEAVVTPLTALQFTQNLAVSDSGDPTQSVAGQALLGAREGEPDPAAQEVRAADAVTTLQRLNAVPEDQRTFENPEWVRFLLFDNRGEIRKSLRPFFTDETHAQLVTRLVGNASLEDEGTASEQVQDITLAEPFGGAGYLGIPLSVVTIAGLPVMLGVGIDYAIQMHSRIEEEVVIDRAAHPIQEASVNLGPALLVVTFDAVFAFLALRFARVPMIRDFGLLLAVGIAVICIASIVIPLAALGIREYRSPTQGKDFSRGNLARLVVWLGSLPTRLALPIAVASAAVFAGGIILEDDLTIQSDPEQWVNQDSQVIHDIDTVKTETGSSAELGIFVESDDLFSDETAAFVTDFANEQLAALPDDLLTASSLVTTVSFLLEMPDTTVLAPTGEDVRRAYDVAPPDIQRAVVNADAGALNLVFRTTPGSLDHRAVYVDAIRDELESGSLDDGEPIPGDVRATPSGLAVGGVGLLENIESNRILLTYLAIAFVFAYLVVRLRSFVRALLS